MDTLTSGRAVLARTAGWAAAIVLAAGAATFLTYGETRSYGFHYDDYHFVRPYPPGEVRAAFQGPWDAAGIERPFYRPLTVAFYAARFEKLGINAYAHHVLSLAMFAVAAAMAGALAWRLTGRPFAGILATLLFVSHPAMPYALVAWVTNQMHLLATLIVLGALAWWRACRARACAWWLPLLGAAAAAFLVKEDGIMLLPAIATLHALRRRLLEPGLPPLPPTFIAAAAGLTVGLLVLRAWALADAPAAGVPDVAQASAHFWRGLDQVVRLTPPDRPWQPLASAFATLVPLTALLVRKRATAAARYTMAAGAAMALLFNLPFVFVTKGEQMHLVATGVVFLLAGSALALWDAARPRVARAAVAVALAAGVLALGAVARHIAADFAPFGPIVLATDRIVLGWSAVPAELRQYLEDKRNPGALGEIPANPAEALPFVAFGLHPWERAPDGTRYRWMSGPRVELLVTAGIRHVAIPLRHEAGAFGEAAAVRVAANGRPADALLLQDGGWRISHVPLRDEHVSPLRGMHRIVVTIDHAWIPAEVFPPSTDTRTLGLQIGELRVR